jgi:hypothetical protein
MGSFGDVLIEQGMRIYRCMDEGFYDLVVASDALKAQRLFIEQHGHEPSRGMLVAEGKLSFKLPNTILTTKGWRGVDLDLLCAVCSQPIADEQYNYISQRGIAAAGIIPETEPEEEEGEEERPVENYPLHLRCFPVLYQRWDRHDRNLRD